MPKRLLILSLALIAAACYEPPETVALARMAVLLDGKSIRPAYEKSEIFMVWTHGRSGLNVEVSRTLEAAGLEDPAADMKRVLVRHLVKRAGAAGAGKPLTFGPEKPGNLVAWARERRITEAIIDVDTDLWGLEWWSGSVPFRAQFRLIDPNSGRVIAQHLCDIRSPNQEQAPKTEENPFPQDAVSGALIADEATPIKAIVGELAERCIEEIISAAL